MFLYSHVTETALVFSSCSPGSIGEPGWVGLRTWSVYLVETPPLLMSLNVSPVFGSVISYVLCLTILTTLDGHCTKFHETIFQLFFVTYVCVSYLYRLTFFILHAKLSDCLVMECELAGNWTSVYLGSHNNWTWENIRISQISQASVMCQFL